MLFIAVALHGPGIGNTAVLYLLPIQHIGEFANRMLVREVVHFDDEGHVLSRRIGIVFFKILIEF
jgi:hypothetical protein